jgi:hypothetical protein
MQWSSSDLGPAWCVIDDFICCIGAANYDATTQTLITWRYSSRKSFWLSMSFLPACDLLMLAFLGSHCCNLLLPTEKLSSGVSITEIRESRTAELCQPLVHTNAWVTK